MFKRYVYTYVYELKYNCENAYGRHLNYVKMKPDLTVSLYICKIVFFQITA